MFKYVNELSNEIEDLEKVVADLTVIIALFSRLAHGIPASCSALVKNNHVIHSEIGRVTAIY